MPTWTKFLKHGREPTVGELADYTFESVVFADGTQLKNVTFEQLANIVWSNASKSSSPTFANSSKSASPSFSNQSKS